MPREKVGFIGRYRQAKQAFANYFMPPSTWNSPVAGLLYDSANEAMRFYRCNRGAAYSWATDSHFDSYLEALDGLDGIREALSRTPGTVLLSSYQKWHYPAQKFRTTKVFFLLDGGCCVAAYIGSTRTQLLLEMTGNDQEKLSRVAQRFKSFFKLKEVEEILPKIHGLYNGKEGVTLTVIGEAKANFEPDNYENDVVSGYEHVVSCLDSRDPCGRLVIIDGPPGTGKSYLIRSIIATTKSVCVIVPNTILQQLSGPALLPVLMNGSRNRTVGDHKRSMTLIIEDADRALIDRRRGSLEALSELLNLSDGILGEMLDLRLIVTTNASRVEMDEAITRAGRLCSHISVPVLPPEQATLVYKRLTGNTPPEEISKDITLADVYRLTRTDKWDPIPKARPARADGGNYV